jgi:TPR repeat protein
MAKLLILGFVFLLNFQFAVADIASEIPENIKVIMVKAEQGDVLAQVALGKYFYNGASKSLRSEEKSFYWYEKAAKKDNLEAQIKLAEYYQVGTGVKGDLRRAEYWLLKAAEKGDVKSQSDLATYYFAMGNEGQHKALPWLRAAATKLDANSLYLLAGCYTENAESDVNLATAAALYRTALKGDPNNYGSFLKTLNRKAESSLEKLTPDFQKQAIALSDKMLLKDNLLAALDEYTRKQPCAW